jgi:integrase
LQQIGHFNPVNAYKDDRWVVRYRKETIPEDPNRTREYFDCGIDGSQAAEEGGSRLLITFPGKPIRSIKTAWKNTKAADGITRRLQPYDLRHAFGTYLLEGGADLKPVSAMTGHSRTGTTTRIYQHMNMDLMRASIAKIPTVEPASSLGSEKGQ